MCLVAAKGIIIFINFNSQVRFELIYDDNIHFIRLKTRLNCDTAMIIKYTHFEKCFKSFLS